MNVVDSPAAHWLPSHVKITVHQARDLHLKNKSGHSELYVSLQVNKDHYITESLPKQLLPHWNEVFVIPLMSLASTIHITVRQKGRFGDSYLGYLPVNPGSFKIGPSPITNWHKLGSKPGKSSTKLRGDLQITFQFLSNWSGQVKRASGDKSGCYQQGGMLHRSLSDLKLGGGAMGHASSDEILTMGKHNQSKAKKEILASLRRSFRKKNKSPVFKNCDEDFASFSSQSVTSTPQIIRKRTNSASVPADTTCSNSLSSTSYLSNGMSDSDTGNSMSPPAQRVGKGFKSPEVEDAVDKASPDLEDMKIPSVNKFRSFKSKKRPWSMQALPVTPSPSSPQVSSERSLGGQNQVFPEELVNEEGTEDAQRCSKSEETERDITTFRYKSRANVLCRSFRGHDSTAARFAARNKSDQDMHSLEGPSVVVSAGSSDEGVGEVVSERPGSGKAMEQTTGAGSQESSVCTSTEGSRTELNVGAGEESVKPPPTFKSHPYSRRIDITPNSSSSPRTRPKILAYGKSELDGKRTSKTGPAMLARCSTLTSIPTTRRILPAPPVRRGSKLPSHTGVTSPSSDEKSESSSNVPTPGPGGSPSAFAAKLADSLEDHMENSGVTGESSSTKRELPAKPRPRAAVRSESLSSLHSKEDPPPSPKVKHTVQFKSRGFQPATLLPPSFTDHAPYHSHTLPTRGKFSRRHSESTKSLTFDESQRKSPSPTKLVRVPDHTPPNMRYTPQALLSQMSQKTPPLKTTPSSSSSLGVAETFSETTDGEKPEETQGSTSVPSSTSGKLDAEGVSPSVKYGGKTPGEIVTSALRNRRPTGALKKAMSLYQESRKHSQKMPSATERTLLVGDGTGRGHMADTDRTSSSARSSPLLVRPGSRTGSYTNLFFNSLRRTSSHISTSASKPRTKSAEDVSSDQNQPDSTHLCDGFLSDLPAGLQNTSAPGLLLRAQQELAETKTPSLQNVAEGAMTRLTEAPMLQIEGEGAMVSPLQDEDEDGATRQTEALSFQEEGSEDGTTTIPEVLIRVRTATMTSADSSSLHTLTDRDVAAAETADVIREQRFSPNPAGAASASSSHVRHTTCGSVESEGFYSATSEEGNMEEVIQQDINQWSKEDLVKELMCCRERLTSTEDRLKEVREYMETLLVRIMDTNPSILSAHS